MVRSPGHLQINQSSIQGSDLNGAGVKRVNQAQRMSVDQVVSASSEIVVRLRLCC